MRRKFFFVLAVVTNRVVTLRGAQTRAGIEPESVCENVENQAYSKTPLADASSSRLIQEIALGSLPACCFIFVQGRGASKLISVGKRMAWRWAKRSAYSAGCGDATLKGLDAGIGACGADCWCWAHFRRVQGLSCLAYLVNYNIFNRSFCEVTFPQVSFHAYSGRNGSV